MAGAKFQFAPAGAIVCQRRLPRHVGTTSPYRDKEEFMYLMEAKERAKELRSFKPTPCKLQDLEELEKWSGHLLPKAYQEFLLWMGRGGSGAFQGSDCFYHRLKDLRSFALELLREDRFEGELPANTFVFYMHQGYEFAFFFYDSGEDPPVYYYREESPTRTSFAQIVSCFSKFILAEIEGVMRLQRSVQ